MNASPNEATDEVKSAFKVSFDRIHALANLRFLLKLRLNKNLLLLS